MKPFYITTPIYYVNAEPHLGHAYTTVVADVAKRFNHLQGRPSRFQTGTDEHGDKIAEAAGAMGIGPKEYADRISAMFRDTWPPLSIENDRFIRTTDQDHIKVVQEILGRVHEAGDIYFAKYGGNYCVGCERFLTDHELVDGRCPDHGTKPEFREEENYFFKMSKYTKQLAKHIEENPDFIRPQRYKNEVLSMLNEDLGDLCISRPKSRLSWGIELPFDENFVTYVWFDALINYITGLGWPEGPLYQQYWVDGDAQHLIAKDILKPHGIYWPTMLMSAGLPLYNHLNVHGYWNVGSGKMSKSIGNVVGPLDMAGIYGPDAFRYFLMREMTFGLDASFSEELLVERYNADLANDLGNLFSRIINMLHQYRGGVIPEPGPALEPENALAGLFGKVRGEYIDKMQGFAFHQGLAQVWELIGAANKYVVSQEPWVLAKDPEKAVRLDTVLYHACRVLAQVAVLIWPVMPKTSLAMFASLGLGQEVEPRHFAISDSKELLPPGIKTDKPSALFPRVDTKKVKAKAAKAEAKAKKKDQPQKTKKKKGPAGEITIDEFARVDLKLGKVLSVEPVEGADRLLKLSVDLGEEMPRQVVSGIAMHYQPDDLIGKQVVVVANLKPVTLRGVESRGMVLACVQGDKVRVVGLDEEMTPGSKVR